MNNINQYLKVGGAEARAYTTRNPEDEQYCRGTPGKADFEFILPVSLIDKETRLELCSFTFFLEESILPQMLEGLRNWRSKNTE